MRTKSTMVELVTELEKLSDSEVRDKLIQASKSGQFHDYRSKAVCGKAYFVDCVAWACTQVSESDNTLLAKMKSDIVEGEYDETLTDEDRAYLKDEMDADNEMSDQDKAFFKAAMGIN